VSRTITIRPDVVPVTVTAILALCYDPGEIRAGLLESELQLYRWTGSSWEGYSTTVDILNHLVTTSDVVGFSHWLIGSLSSTPTAITLRDLTATANTSPGVIGAAGAALAALAVLIGRRKLNDQTSEVSRSASEVWHKSDAGV
jgi:hypothetical protein